MKRLLNDPSLFLLLGGNAWCIWYFSQHPSGFSNIIWIYWWQSVVIGLFNFIELLTLERFDSTDFRVNDEQVTAKNKGCLAWFFLLHYGIFHFVYMIFLSISYHSNIELNMIILVTAGFVLESFMGFRRRRQSAGTVNIGTLFFLPYLRIVPMHLTILLPSFLHVTPSIFFLVLKTVADIGFHFISHWVYHRQKN